MSTGPQDDLRSATDLARQMVCLFGMSERVGLVQCARPADAAYLGQAGALVRDCSEETSREIDHEVRTMLEDALSRARGILESERGLLEHIAAELLEKETLEGPDLERLEREGARGPSEGQP